MEWVSEHWLSKQHAHFYAMEWVSEHGPSRQPVASGKPPRFTWHLVFGEEYDPPLRQENTCLHWESPFPVIMKERRHGTG